MLLFNEPAFQYVLGLEKDMYPPEHYREMFSAMVDNTGSEGDWPNDPKCLELNIQDESGLGHCVWLVDRDELEALMGWVNDVLPETPR